jgi:uncharacterized protein (DUF885 family)
MSDAVDFDRWVEEFAADCVRSRPQLATSALYFSGAEQDALDRDLVLANNYGGTYGAGIAQTQAALARRGLDELACFCERELTDKQRTSAAVLRWNLDNIVTQAAFARHRFIFNQFVGLHVTLVMFLANIHPLRNERDAENYLARLALVPARLGEGIAEATAAAAEGIVPPRFILERTIEQLDGLMAPPPADHVLVATFARRIEVLHEVPAARRVALVALARDDVRDNVLPAFARVRAMLVAQMPESGDAAGAWRLPAGKAFYARELAAATGSSLAAEQIHEIGLREVARIEAEMDEILTLLGYAEGPIATRVERLNETLQLLPDPDPRDAILAELAAIVSDAQSRSEAVFDLRPKAPVVVKREPAFSERSAAAHYTPPAPDGSQPGVYWAPLADLGVRVPWLGIGLKSTAYHEAIPGHHFQLAIQQESTELPRFRKLGAFGYDPSFAEGWALYAEQLCAENDWYAADLPARLGYLQMQLFRARRLVVDTGLHEMEWTRQQAIDYGFTAAEIERYVVWPGQACSYMIGRLRILEIRERAKAALGENFSIKEFHNLVLGGGTMPLDILASEVDAWVRSFGETNRFQP